MKIYPSPQSSGWIFLGDNWLVATKSRKLQRKAKSCNEINKVATNTHSFLKSIQNISKKSDIRSQFV
jgi:hypothetical protein